MSRDFDAGFRALTGWPPFPWQLRLYEQFVAGNFPTACSLPTGVGKTSTIAVWLLALANAPTRMPRRLVYVVNRRTVVDQTTDEVRKYRANLEAAGLRSPLEKLCAIPLKDGHSPLALSTLRGQFADNQEWSADPARPAVICGTVDMIGSRLLFGGYRIGFKSRPLHAGFLGQDVLLVHDEAHLEPAFQRLAESIEREQREAERTGNLPWRKLQVIALSATARHDGAERPHGSLTLDADDYEDPIVRERMVAEKSLRLHFCKDEKKQLASQIAELALTYEGSDSAVLVFVRGVDGAMAVLERLAKACSGRVVSLTGTMRGLERDGLVRDSIFIRFLPESSRPRGVPLAEGTVYLVCTSAGEVGVNLSADHMVCDLSTFESMAQRLGRVNRFGERDDTRVDVVYAESFDDKDALTPARKETLKLLRDLNGDASPKALGQLMNSLSDEERRAAFAPEPTVLPTSDVLFDAWAMTSIRDRMPGRPAVAPYLHGIAEWEPPRTSVTWRDEVDYITRDLIDRYGKDIPQSLLDDYPLKPHETLSETSDRVYKALGELSKRLDQDCPVWLIRRAW